MPEDTNAADQAPLTAQQIVEIVNAAVSSHMKRQPDVKALIQDALKAVAPAPVAAPVQEESDTPKKGKVPPEVAALQVKLDELSKLYKDEQSARTAAEKKGREDRAYNELRASLTGHVRPDVLDDVAKLMFHVDKRVEVDESGNHLLKVRRAPAFGLPEEDQLMPLQDGIAAWAKGKSAAPYVPAPNPTAAAAQTPARGSRMPTQQSKVALPKYEKPAMTDDEKLRRAFELETALSNKA